MQRVHREWFMLLSKTTCYCGQRHTQVYAWGEYLRAKWRTVDHFCQACFKDRILSRLIAHAGPCGCSFEFCARSGHGPLPEFLKLGEASCNVKAA